EPDRRPALCQGRPPDPAGRWRVSTHPNPDVTAEPERTAYEHVVPAEGPRGWRRVATELLRRPVGVASILVLLGVIVLALFGDWLAPYEINDINIADRLQSPNAQYWFGTDELGRDILSRVIASSAVSVRVSVIAVSIALVVGVTMGLLAGFFGGWLD